MREKRSFLFVLFFTAYLYSFAQYDKQNIDLLGHWYNPSELAEPGYGIKYQSVWGWVDTVHNNAEYAIQGSTSGTYFIDVSTPTNPVVRDFVAGRRNQCIWREYKTYGHYLYTVSDDGSPNSLQIIDMSYLPDSVHVVYDGTTLFERSHTTYIDGNKLYCGSVTLPNAGGYYSMAVYSLANPELPVLLRTLNEDDATVNTVHDMFVRNDTVYASCGYQGLFIYKFNSNNTFTPINSLTSYPDQGYNHSGFLAPDGKTLIFCDEVPRNMAVKLVDVSDLQNISIQSTFKSTEGATAHNPYIVGTNRAVIAYYMDGIQIYNIENPAAPSRTGYFDTDTIDGINNNYNEPNTAYRGCWGAYVDLPSKIILASDMQNGLFILNAEVALGVDEKNKLSTNKVFVYPNPAKNDVSLKFTLDRADYVLIELMDVTGRVLVSQKEQISSGTSIKTVVTEYLATGVYMLNVSGKQVRFSEKIIRD